jgi:hypothetical protein
MSAPVHGGVDAGSFDLSRLLELPLLGHALAIEENQLVAGGVHEAREETVVNHVLVVAGDARHVHDLIEDERGSLSALALSARS